MIAVFTRASAVVVHALSPLFSPPDSPLPLPDRGRSGGNRRNGRLRLENRMNTKRMAEDCHPPNPSALERHLDTLDDVAVRAFAHALSNGHGWDCAAQMAVVHGPIGTVVTGPFGSYRHGTRDRIRYTDATGTRTIPFLSRAARNHRRPMRRGLLCDCQGCVV